MHIHAITVTLLAPMSDHIANGGEKLLGNASSIKRRPDGRVYVSGQMQRHALFSALDRLNLEHPDRGDTYVANGDGTPRDIQRDLRSDLGGFLDPRAGDYTGRRTAPLTATPAVAQDPSDVRADMLLQLQTMNRDHNIATQEVSQHDLMRMSFSLDCGAVGLTKRFRYDDEKHVSTDYQKHVSDDERKRRARLALDSTRSLTDYANQARNATSGEPQQVLIVLDTKLSRKAARYFAPETTDAERDNLRAELDARGALVFLGDDTTADGDSVYEAYEKAFVALDAHEIYDPSHGAEPAAA